MKKSLIVLGMVGMLVLAGCNKEEVTPTEGGETPAAAATETTTTAPAVTE